MNHKMTFRDSGQAFEDAIFGGALSDDPQDRGGSWIECAGYVGDFMYMGTQNGVDLFKNKNTRKYVHVKNGQLVRP